ncbi:uncharacterized protein LOC106168016 [Lingula anatina]|uniref:Uncharacterized protein LOC106168016 n=1 Tax=Lingula anatina TaxID=7574 RepID=A0A1S3IW25_LINAN|nr:uncharacterized protein LOC106168016 [Lingula anatina]|eukprot:XP_013402392.1 uncharacterized protein LOC106168016 [Lingula anatina]
MATTLGIPSEIPRNEKENYFRMRLLLERATDVLRDVLRTQLQAAYPGLFDPSKTDKLFDILDNQQVKHSLLLLKKRKVINSSQMKLLYPSGTPSATVTTQDLDITLAVVLLRNITNLNPRAKWENPPASDTSIEANIGRVKTYRNNHMHGSPGINDTVFQAEFNAFKHVLLSLSPIYTSDDYEKLLIVPLEAKVAPCQLLSVQLPGKLADLKGREDLVQQIQQHIAGETRLVLLTGMGGIGKTSVAIEVGHRKQNVLYIDMRQVTNLESVKLSLVQYFHPTRSLKDLYSDYHNILTQTFSSSTSNTVIIFDNNDEVIKSSLQEFHNLVQTILNSTKHITLLCTSREAFSLVSHKMAVVEVPPLDKAPSIGILWEGKPNSPTDSESLVLGEIAEKCGGNPLALKLLAVQLKKKNAQRVLDRMKNKNVIESLKVANLPASQEMMACLDMSYETLNTEEQKVFRALHIFPVPFSLEEVSEMLEIDEDECESILDSLCNKSLLSVDPSFYDFHPLLRAYAAFQAQKYPNEIEHIQEAYCKHYMKQTPLLVSEFDTLSSKETYEKALKILPHLKFIACLLSDQLGNKKLHDKEIRLRFLKSQNLFVIACVFQNLFLYAEAITYYEKSLEVKKEILGEKHPDTALTYQNIGSVLSKMGRFAEALLYHKKSLLINKEIHGDKHPNTAAQYQNIGNALCNMGKPAEGLTYYEKSIGIMEEILGEKHPDTAVAYQNIATALCDMGKYAEAFTYFEKSLGIMKEILGEKHTKTATTYVNIGVALYFMGKYAEALPYYEQSLGIMKEILGDKHPDTAATYQDIGNALRRMGKYAEALTYYEKSLEIKKEILGEKHTDTAVTYMNIGTALCFIGNYIEALTNYEKSREVYVEHFGAMHPKTMSLDSFVRDVKRGILMIVIMNMSKYIATELIVKGEYGQGDRFLSFIGWDFKLYYKF